MKSESFTPGAGTETVLALHSSMSSKSQWRALADCLAPDYRVVAVDLHGYGANPLPGKRDPFDLADEVNLAAGRAIEAMGAFEPVHVVGHSYGGAVALSLARMRPEMVRSLTVYEPVCFALLDREGPFSSVVRTMAGRVAQHVEREELDEAARVFLEYWGGLGAHDRSRAETRERARRAVRKVPLDFTALLRAPRSPSWYSRIGASTLILSGRSSPESVREIARILWSAIPASRLAEMEGDHLLPITRPEVVNAEIARFLLALRDAPSPAGSGASSGIPSRANMAA